MKRIAVLLATFVVMSIGVFTPTAHGALPFNAQSTTPSGTNHYCAERLWDTGNFDGMEYCWDSSHYSDYAHYYQSGGALAGGIGVPNSVPEIKLFQSPDLTGISIMFYRDENDSCWSSGGRFGTPWMPDGWNDQTESMIIYDSSCDANDFYPDTWYNGTPNSFTTPSSPTKYNRLPSATFDKLSSFRMEDY